MPGWPDWGVEALEVTMIMRGFDRPMTIRIPRERLIRIAMGHGDKENEQVLQIKYRDPEPEGAVKDPKFKLLRGDFGGKDGKEREEEAG